MSETPIVAERTQLDAEPLPQPSFAPVALSLGVMMLVWGILTHWSMSLFGLGVMAWSLSAWINQVCRQWSVLDGKQE